MKPSKNVLKDFQGFVLNSFPRPLSLAIMKPLTYSPFVGPLLPLLWTSAFWWRLPRISKAKVDTLEYIIWAKKGSRFHSPSQLSATPADLLAANMTDWSLFVFTFPIRLSRLAMTLNLQYISRSHLNFTIIFTNLSIKFDRHARHFYCQAPFILRPLYGWLTDGRQLEVLL